jgi:hypothetical protein
MDPVEHGFHVRFRFAFGKLGEERRGRLGNTAARANETDVRDFVTVEDQEELELIAAQGIVAMCRAGGLRQLMEIARLLAMVQDDLLIKIIDIVKHSFKTLFAAGTPPLAAQ